MWQVITALICIMIGYKADPFKSRLAAHAPSSAEITQAIKKVEAYISVGNLSGAKAQLKALKKAEPDNIAINKLEKHLAKAIPTVKHDEVERLPASLRDSVYDSFLAAKSGDCSLAKNIFQPVQRYLGIEVAENLPMRITSYCNNLSPHKEGKIKGE